MAKALIGLLQRIKRS